MKDDREKTREELIEELQQTREKVTELEFYKNLALNIDKAIPDKTVFIDQNGCELYSGDRLEKLDAASEKVQSQLIEEAIETNEIKLFQYFEDTPEGRIWFERRVVPMAQQYGDTKELILITRNITEQKQAEERIKQSERDYRTLVESLPENIVLKDINHYFISCNSLFSSHYGRTPEEIAGMHTNDLYEPELAARLIEADTRVIETGEPQIVINTNEEDKNDLVFESLKTPVRDSRGKIIGIISIIKDITQQRRAEEALRFSDAALKSIQECVYAMDNEFRITYWNHISEELFGIKAADALGKQIVDIIDMEEDRPRHNLDRMDLLMEQGHNREEQLYITPNGKIWVDVYAQAIEQNGVRYGWITLASDISEKKKAEEDLRISEERFSKAFRSVPDSIIISTIEDGTYLEVNDSFVQFSGYSKEEIIGKTAKELGAWADMKDREYVVAKLKSEGRVVNYEHEMKKKSGELAIALINVELIDLGGMQCMLSVITDITERKKAEEQVRYQASLVDNITEAIISHDQNMKIISWNKTAKEIFQFSEEDIIGKDIRELCRIEPINVTMQGIRDSVQQKGYWRGEAIHHLNNGKSIYMRISTIVVQGNYKGKTSYVLIMSDITEEKKAEEELKQHYEQEIRLRHEIENEMKKRSEFSSAIVHELKTPLTAIISSSDLLMESIESGAIQRLAQNINSSAYELDKRITELLDMARGELEVLEINPAPMNLLDAVNAMKFDFNILASRKSQTFSAELPESLPVITADESRIRQVLFNLINNAIKYTRENGTITLKMKESKSDIRVEIRDTGSGLTAKEQETVFEPYRQLIDGTRVEGGMGLGLAISRNIIKAHGGTIGVESKKGKGSSFYFTLPKTSGEDKN